MMLLIVSFTFSFLVQHEDLDEDQKAYYYLEKAVDQVHLFNFDVN